MNKSILLATIAVLLVAGCTGQGGNIFNFQQITTTTVGGAGLVISDFAADTTPVFGGSTDRLLLTFSNAGGFDVPNNGALAYLTGSALSFNTSDDSHIYWLPTGSDTETKSGLGALNAADVVQGTDGTEKTLTWSLKAPNITSQTRNDVFIARVYANYETDVSGTVWIYSQTESDSARAAGRSLNVPTFSSTSGPVALTVKTIPSSVVLNSPDTFTLQIKVSSVGGGTLYRYNKFTTYSGLTGSDLGLSDTDLNHVYITVNAPGLSVGSECQNDQELIGGKSITLSCTVSPSAYPTTFQGYPITITAQYGYFTERTASVTVQKR